MSGEKNKNKNITLRYIGKGSIEMFKEKWVKGNLKSVPKDKAKVLLMKFPKRFQIIDSIFEDNEDSEKEK